MPWSAPFPHSRLTSLFGHRAAPALQHAPPPSVEVDGVSFEMVCATTPSLRGPSHSSLDTLDSTPGYSPGLSTNSSLASSRASVSSAATSLVSAREPTEPSTSTPSSSTGLAPRQPLAAHRVRRPSVPLPPNAPSAPLLRNAPFSGAEPTARAEAGLLRRASAPARPQQPPPLPQLARGIAPEAQAQRVEEASNAEPQAWKKLLSDAGESAQRRRLPRRRTDSPLSGDRDMQAVAAAPPSVGGLAHAPSTPSRLREVALPRDGTLTRPPLSSPPGTAPYTRELKWLSAELAGASLAGSDAARVVPPSPTYALPAAQLVARRHFYREAGNVDAALAQLRHAPEKQLRVLWHVLAADFVALNRLLPAAWPELPPTGTSPLLELADKDAQHLVELWNQLAVTMAQMPALVGRGRTVRLVRHRLAPAEGELLSFEAAGSASVQLPPIGLVGRLRAASPTMPALALALRTFAEKHGHLAAGCA